MSRVVKVAVSLPGNLLEAADHARQARGETRSAFFREAIEAWLREQEEREAVARYVEAYRRWPESDEELAVAELANTVLAQEPWE